MIIIEESKKHNLKTAFEKSIANVYILNSSLLAATFVVF